MATATSKLSDAAPVDPVAPVVFPVSGFARFPSFLGLLRTIAALRPDQVDLVDKIVTVLLAGNINPTDRDVAFVLFQLPEAAFWATLAECSLGEPAIALLRESFDDRSIVPGVEFGSQIRIDCMCRWVRIISTRCLANAIVVAPAAFAFPYPRPSYGMPRRRPRSPQMPSSFRTSSTSTFTTPPVLNPLCRWRARMPPPQPSGSVLKDCATRRRTRVFRL